MNKTTFYITTWNKDKTNNVKSQLIEQGVSEKDIYLIEDRTTRSIALNKRIKECPTEYVGLFDDDVILEPNLVKTLESTLDKYGNVGFVVAPVQQKESLSVPKPDMPITALDDQSLENISSKLWTFNASIYRKACGVLMDEDYFGNQLLDWDFGLELWRNGFASVADHRTAVMHKQTSYHSKNLVYHAVVARSRHIFMRKWQKRTAWVDTADYNRYNNNEIPTIEEITHASDKWLFDYISKYDVVGLINHWYQHRFCKEENFKNFIEDFEKNYVSKETQIFRPILNQETGFVDFK